MRSPNNPERWKSVLKSLQQHYAWRDGGPLTVSSIETRLGITLPSDLKFFYANCDGVRLFRDFDAPFAILSSNKVDYINAVLGEKNSTNNIIAICYCRDSDYIGIRLFPDEDAYEIVDCWHESFPDFSNARVISRSLLEFLEDLLGSGGHKFWLGRER